jgi:hypothetical protein
MSSVQRALHENQLYPFRIQPVQVLQPENKHLCLQFMQWVLQETVETPQFLSHVLWIDEAVFTICGEYSLLIPVEIDS